MIIVMMGVAGSGKTTVGAMLATALDCAYLDADALHPPANIAAMARGVALTDVDRVLWLRAIHRRIVEAHEADASLVVGCSALKESYRRILSEDVPVIWVYLRGSRELIRERLRHRVGHFFDEALLDSQLDTLEEPRDAIVIDVEPAPRVIVEEILVRVSGRRAVRVLHDVEELSAAAAEAVAAVIIEVVAGTGRCSLMLSGGTTPRGMHRVLATRFRSAVPWARVHVFWSDERYVPADDPDSNYGMARATLLDDVACAAAHIHPMPTSFADPDAAARAYEATLHSYFHGARPSFDIAILGIGTDGHTASLFPSSPALLERERWVLAVNAHAEPRVRLTLTLPVLLASARSFLLVAGAGKALAVRRALARDTDPYTVPAAALQRARGSVSWWVERSAAAQLDAAMVHDAVD